MKVIEQKIRSLYHSTVFLLLASEFLHIFSFFRVCLCRHFVCFSPVSRPRTQILSLFILAAILNKFPLSVDKSVTWFLLCARVFSPAAAILEREKTLGTRLVQKQSSCKPPSLLEDLTATEILFQSYAATTTIDRTTWLACISHYVRGHVHKRGHDYNDAPLSPPRTQLPLCSLRPRIFFFALFATSYDAWS